jgi:hypothetical protein
MRGITLVILGYAMYKGGPEDRGRIAQPCDLAERTPAL